MAILVVAALVSATSLSVRMASAQAGTSPINGGTTSYGVAYDAAKGEVFVSNWSNDSVSVISDASGKVTATIPLGSGNGAPYGVVYDPARGEVFVSESTIGGPGAVSVISDSTNAVVATVPIGQQASGEAYDPARGEVFVANSYDGTVSVISDSNDTVVKTLGVMAGPVALAYDAAKGEIFVAESGGQRADGDMVTVISDSTLAAVANITVGTGPYGAAYDPAKSEVFVSDAGSSSVSVISDSTNAVVATVPVGTDPFGLVYDPARSEVFVANEGEGTLSVISDSTNSVVKTQSLGSAGGIALAYDASKGEVIDAGQGTLILPDTLSGVGTTTTNGGASSSSRSTSYSVSTSSVPTTACSVLSRTAPGATAAVGAWVPTKCYPFPTSSQSCASSGGYVYCVGGDVRANSTNAVYFAPVSSAGVGAWSATTSYPVPVLGESCQISSGYIYCVGGQESTTVLSEVLADSVYYAPVSSSGVGAWTQTSSYPTSIAYQACAVSPGQIYCVGGFSNSAVGRVSQGASGVATILGTTNASYYADITSSGLGAWTQTTTYPLVDDGQSCEISSGFIYCVGGSTVELRTTSSGGTSTQAFTPATLNSTYYAPVSASGIGNWTATTAYPTTIYDQSCEVSSSEMYCVGGDTVLSPSAVSSVYVAPVSSTGIGAWSQTTSYPIALDAQACSISDGSIFCIGGFAAAGDTNAVCYAQLGSGSGSATGASECSQSAVQSSASSAASSAASTSSSSSTALPTSYVALLGVQAVVVAGLLLVGRGRAAARTGSVRRA